MIRTAICGATLIAPAGLLKDRALLLRGDRIAAVLPQTDIPSDVRREELNGGYIVPGFIDIQVNGGGGVLFNDQPTREGMAAIATAHRKFGSTGIMPTLISDDLHVVDIALAAADAAVAAGDPGILGIHIEGPFINAGKRGIHDATKFRTLDEAAFALLTRPGPARRMVTIAPELVPPGTIRRLVEAGLIVCAGHSLANYEQTRAALAEGLAGYTHLFNAMTQMGSREPGMVGAALDDRNSQFGLIVDGLHVHPAVLRVALAARGRDGAILVTDAMPTVGSAVDHFILGGRRIVVDGDACRAEDGTLAGSNLNMGTAFANTVHLLNQTPVNTSRMASGNPAKFLGRDAEMGALLPGLKADLVHLSAELKPLKVWLSGQAVQQG
jgi:N-acetylglucosamine-6-phosphate deacetylase